MIGRKHILFLALVAMVFVACEPDRTCRQDTEVEATVVLKCFHFDTLDVMTTEETWDSITVQGVGSDSVLYQNKKGVKHVYIPLRDDTTVTAFRMTWQGKTETLYIRHDNTQRFVSMACGCVVYHQIEHVWTDKVWADSVMIVNAGVEAAEQDNICIYATKRDEKP